MEKLYGDENINETTLETEEQIEDSKGEYIFGEEFEKAKKELKRI